MRRGAQRQARSKFYDACCAGCGRAFIFGFMPYRRHITKACRWCSSAVQRVESHTTKSLKITLGSDACRDLSNKRATHHVACMTIVGRSLVLVGGGGTTTVLFESDGTGMKNNKAF